MGSLLLTRSFTVKSEILQAVQTRESGPEGVNDPDAMMMEEGHDLSHSMEVDDNDEEEDEDEEEIVVLPLADLLNARYGHDNVCSPLGFRTE